MIDRERFSTNDPIGDESLERLASFAGGWLPPDYVALLREANGFADDEGLTVFSAEEVPERNETFDVKAHAPGYLMIGNDGSGRGIMLSLSEEKAPIFVVGHGDMSPEGMVVVAPSLPSWAGAGFRLPSSDVEEDWTRPVDVYIERMPKGGIKDLLLVKKELRLDLGLPKLKELTKQLPARILEGVPYGKYRKRCNKVNAQLDCLEIRDPRDPSRELLLD